MTIKAASTNGEPKDSGESAKRKTKMKAPEATFREFVDAIQTASDVSAFERVAGRLTQSLGFQRFAYLSLAGDSSMLISSYPKSWTNRYFDLRYQQLDPVIIRARVERDLFSWGGPARSPAANREQRQFFDEATTFGIRSGITVPIRGGFGRMAAFTLATNDRDIDPDRLTGEWRDLVYQVGLYFHVHVAAKIDGAFVAQPDPESGLTQRECQCLAWTAQGKTVADVAVLVAIAPRTVVFHLENARRKLGAASIAQCVAIALRRGLLS
ncbi:autoinducer binding domain-containing protein [Bradyrhizobium sp. AUGA SZCCT0240]|uniref:autoinducer binding domain-containing protein n=1 Tax=unclassified Bradyrhizobium TaxID=2631580 RepID=UPI001BA54DBD|nr:MULTISPECIES: autoinducer binding domain-containing protein [unclassified Bradyrhizobium]MBR1194192.1 autoinducer binding domain-containing protein [Bradyrhizobium sp. AUGA SZCCT0160]MBR1243490.1 autoinducer binding domain-containing protein [Bradyrhizobium sp. AUGA SZCCT0274]MBR1258385.1 autoinducer binding domain-containing protein [Bradyrhizobium sp. AUGA SZCCT0240]